MNTSDITRIVRKIQTSKLTIAFAESATAGMLASEIVKAKGTGTTFLGSIVTYNESVKQILLGVKKKTLDLYSAVIAVGSISLNLVTKFFFHRDRPIIPHLVEASGLSFPSGHSMVSASFYGLLIYLSWHNIQNRTLHYLISGLLVLTILLIGASRVYLHVHFATDVIAGFSAGFLWVILGVYGLRRLERYSKRNLNPIVQEAAVKVE